MSAPLNGDLLNASKNKQSERQIVESREPRKCYVSMQEQHMRSVMLR